MLFTYLSARTKHSSTIQNIDVKIKQIYQVLPVLFFSERILSYAYTQLLYLISIYDELFRFKEDTVEIENTATDTDMTEGEGNCLSGDILIIGAY